MSRVLITGASGFVGRHLLPTLQQSELRLALHRETREPGISGEHVVVGEIDQRTDWSTALKGVDCVIHMAARVHVMKPTPADRLRFDEVNCLGTERLALAAVKAGAKRFVFLSSVKVNGEVTHGAPFGPKDVGNPVDDYGLSKYHAEQKLFAIARRSGIEVVVIRPPLVYGPGVRANFLRLMSWVHRGVPLPLGAIRNSRSLVSVWNLCDLIKRVCEAPAVASGVLMVSDGVDLSTPDLIRQLAASMNRKPRLISMPVSMLKIAGAVCGQSPQVARLCESLTVDITETKHHLAWTPPVTIDEGMARTVRWYINEMGARSG